MRKKMQRVLELILSMQVTGKESQMLKMLQARATTSTNSVQTKAH